MPILLKSDSVIEKLTPLLSDRCHRLKARNITPKMQVLLVGENPASLVYVRNKKKLCEKIGAICDVNHLPASISASDFERHIKNGANDPFVHGMFVQLPLPKQLAEVPIDHLIPSAKDVDGFHPENIFGVFSASTKNSYLCPCTPKGIITMLDHYNISLSGKKVIIIGRSKIVGRPLALLMLGLDGTVTMAHSKTPHLPELTREHDVVVAAIGRCEMLDETYFREAGDQIVIDVGMNKRPDGKLAGDVNFEAVVNKVHAITPVPGGVGPMTVVSLIENLLIATELQNK